MTLFQLFTAIANAIRAKKGTQETIAAEDFPTEIAGITTGNLDNEEYAEANNDLDDILQNTTVPTGTINITTNGEHDVTNYVTANVNVSGPKPVLPDGIKFYNSQCTDMNWLTNVDTSGITKANDMFNACPNLVTIPSFDTSNITNANYMFLNCPLLENIGVLNFKNVTAVYGMFNLDTSLSDNTLNNILASILTMENYTGTKTLKYMKLDSIQATKCTTLSNWAAVQAAGWTTGY